MNSLPGVTTAEEVRPGASPEVVVVTLGIGLGPSQIGASWLSMGGKGVPHYLPIVPKASIYVPKVMLKPVMGGNTVSETFTHIRVEQLRRKGST